MKGIQRTLLRVGDRLVRLARRENDDPGEGQLTVRRTHLGREPV